MLGSHLSIAGGMVNALDEAERLGMSCVQVFTKNQRQWAVKPLADADRDAWLAKQKAMGWHKLTGPLHVVSHNSYLINMASPDADARAKSINLQRIELERCETLRIRACVAHPGAHLGKPRKPGTPNELGAAFSKDELAGLKRIVKSLDAIHVSLPGYRVQTALETTVGSGTNLGYDFAHLAFIRDNVKEPERIGFCLDTCHVLAAGYDVTTESAAKAMWKDFDATCGIRDLRVIHMNDSQGELGSRRDRHDHIGQGHCGVDCFRVIMNHKRLQRVPKVLETEKADADDGTPWDLKNLAFLEKLRS